MLSYDFGCTLAIVRELAQGKRLTLSDGLVIGMGEDMSIGFVIVGSDGSEHIAGLSTMDLCQLNQLLKRYDVGMVIP